MALKTLGILLGLWKNSNSFQEMRTTSWASKSMSKYFFGASLTPERSTKYPVAWRDQISQVWASK